MRVIGPPLDDVERAALVAAVRAQVGTKFRHRGRSGNCVDCVGALVVAMRSIGREVRDLRAYGRNPHDDGLRRAIEDNLGRPIPGEPRAGDVLMLRTSGAPHHVGLVGEYDGRLTLIHADAEVRRVVEVSLAEPWTSRIVEVYRP